MTRTSHQQYIKTRIDHPHKQTVESTRSHCTTTTTEPKTLINPRFLDEHIPLDTPTVGHGSDQPSATLWQSIWPTRVKSTREILKRSGGARSKWTSTPSKQPVPTETNTGWRLSPVVVGENNGKWWLLWLLGVGDEWWRSWSLWARQAVMRSGFGLVLLSVSSMSIFDGVCLGF